MFKYLVLGAVTAYALYRSFFGGDRDGDDPPPSRPRSYEPPQPRIRDERQYQQTNITSQYQRTTAPSQKYQRTTNTSQRYQTASSTQTEYTPSEACTLLRDGAKQEAALMTQCFQQSKEAYKRREGARAKALSELGKRHELEMEKLNAKAAAIVFQENNKNKSPCDVDLHGLYVKEAIDYSAKVIEEARLRDDPEIRLIVGQGTHSDGGISRLKPAIQKDLRKRGIHVDVHPRNPGVLIVQLDSE